LRKICPDINSEGVVLTIPMPGHPYANALSTNESSPSSFTDEDARKEVERLILDHDVVFTLTDSREAR
jgi:ubiquitin-like modifier-activating enzyme ATG7